MRLSEESAKENPVTMIEFKKTNANSRIDSSVNSIAELANRRRITFQIWISKAKQRKLSLYKQMADRHMPSLGKKKQKKINK